MSGYTSGDSKWVPDAVPVTGGTYYTFSDWYRSNASTAVSVYYELASDTDKDNDGLIDGHWANLFSGIAPKSDWTQYKTGFTMPAGAVRAQFVHFIARNGWLETDDYSLTEQDAPPGFSKPMISLTFDDGSQGFWDNARTPLKDKGFKTTQYVPTGGLTSTPRDTFMMTPDEITTLARDGNEIGAHSVTHPFMTTLTDAQLADELGDSKKVLESLPGVGAGTVRNFAYPYGDYDARVIAAEEGAGYRSGRSVEEGYNSKLDLEAYDIRVQNMTPETTLDQFKSWIDYAKAHNYWLVIVYHEVVPDSAPRCLNTNADPDPCLADFDTKVSNFKEQLDAISSAGLGPDVVTVQQALDTADAEMHGPVAGTVKVTPASAMTGTTLTATPSAFSDPDGDTLTYQYQWKVNGNAITGATDATFDLSQAGHGDRGDVIAVDVSARDPKGHVSTGVNDSVTVGNTAPTKGSVAINPSSPLAGTELTATPTGFSDADGDELTYTYAWFRNGEAIAGATSKTLPASAAIAIGDEIRIEAQAHDGHDGTSDAATATVTVGNTAPVKGSVAINPSSPLAGTALTANPAGFSDADHDALTYTYAWFRNDKVIAGATTKTLPASAFAAGDQIRVEVRAHDGHGGTSDAAIGRVTVGKPTATSTPTPKPAPSATPTPGPRPDTVAPSIVVTSPKAHKYKVGRSLKIKISCTDGSGQVQWTATVRRSGGKARTVKQDGKLHLSRAGRYVLRVTAKDRAGNSATKTVRFRVVRK